MPDYYTRTGDDGTTGLLGDLRVPKDHLRIETVGAIDEANAALGVARVSCTQPTSIEIILVIQRDFYKIMSEIAATPENQSRFRSVDETNVKWLEERIEIIGSYVEIPDEFIVPGDTMSGAVLDLARTIIRRAERRLSTLYRAGEIENPDILPYFNRLSSLCFILEVWETLSSSETPISKAKDANK